MQGDGRLKDKDDMSGLCATKAAHFLCRGEWDTPSVHVTCRCECHAKKQIVAKVMAKKLVPKK